MNPAPTLALYAGGLAVAFALAAGLGSAVGPVGAAAPPPAAEHGSDEAGDETHGSAGSGDEHGGGTAAPADLAPGGLAVAADGYGLELATTTQPAGTPSTLRFTVTGPDGEPLTDYERSHDKDLHLIVVRRDLTGYQHLHPERDAAGEWSVPLTLAEAGPYKVYADFQPVGRERSLVLAADLTAPGPYAPEPLPAPSDATSVEDLDVTLDGGLVAGTSSPLTFTVRRDGRPVTDLEPYLGAYGHLVALREGDLAYLHVHPEGEAAPGPEIAFAADVPSPATYRLFLDLKHAGAVRTAELTATATRSGT